MGDDAKKLAIAQKLVKLAEARGMSVDQLMQLMALDTEAIGEVLKPPEENKPQYAFNRWDGKDDPTELEKKFDDDAKKEKRSSLKRNYRLTRQRNSILITITIYLYIQF